MSEQDLLSADLFPKYVQLRTSGLTVDETLESMAELTLRLSIAQQKQLSTMIATWEANRSESDGESLSHPAQPLAPDQVACPNCGRPNHKAGFYCYACGHILPHAPETKQLYGRYDSMDLRVRWGTASFEKDASLVLLPQYGAPIEVDLPENEDITIGRISGDPVAIPTVNLADLAAGALGVSRLHLVVRRQAHTITVADLGSVNYTYINGKRLYPHELRVLRDGDELRLGRMMLRVRFKFRNTAD